MSWSSSEDSSYNVNDEETSSSSDTGSENSDCGTSKLSEYELKRLENIRQNQEEMKRLGLPVKNPVGIKRMQKQLPKTSRHEQKSTKRRKCNYDESKPTTRLEKASTFSQKGASDHRYPQRHKNTLVCYQEEVLSDDDKYLNCRDSSERDYSEGDYSEDEPMAQLDLTSGCDKAFNQVHVPAKVHAIGNKAKKQIFTCGKCCQTFCELHDLQDHIRKHEELKKQDNMKGKFSQRKQLFIKSTHSEKKNFECDHCGKPFNHSGDLQKHLQTHTGDLEKQYQSDKTVSQNSHLKPTQTTEKLYQCEKTGSQNIHLQQPLPTETIEKLFQCTYCDKTFTMNCTLQLHLLTHQYST